jgi:hypothetical protein
MHPNFPVSDTCVQRYGGTGMPSKAKATAITDHEEIRRWAEERSAKPSCVRNTGGKGDIGIIRLDFPGYSGEQSLKEISWDDWFQKFDEQGLALLHQETTADGQKSNFNKLVSRETAKSGIAKTKSVATASKSSSTAKAASTSKAESRSVKRNSEVKPAQKRETVTNISRKQEGAKPSPHSRPSRGRAA